MGDAQLSKYAHLNIWQVNIFPLLKNKELYLPAQVVSKICYSRALLESRALARINGKMENETKSEDKRLQL